VALLSTFIASFLGRNRPIGSVEKIFFGIGNPGRRYRNTRHNAGFAALEWFSRAASSHATFRRDAWEAIICKRENLSIALVKPKTYVNRCGEALVDCLSRLHCPLSSCLVIVDDYHLPLGKVRLRPGGSDGGHNGLKSIITVVGESFPRLRIGIGPLPDNTETVQFVLGRFSASEMPMVQSTLTKAEGAMLMFAQHGIDRAMNIFNK
jgi:peptidyl-tRNA hydrolase, PTH1 family